MISAKIICDSAVPSYFEHKNNKDEGKRLTTFVVTFPRFILAEVNTHRVFSRNSASSRAIPNSKIRNMVINEPVLPVSFGKNQKGMQAGEEITGLKRYLIKSLWLSSRWSQLFFSSSMSWLGCHKQVCNRLLEPYIYTTAIITSSDYDNFFNLRCNKNAQPEFQELAYAMRREYLESKPKILHNDQYHLPFCDKYINENLSISSLIKISVARCARVSYLNFEGDIDHEKDYKLYDSLLENKHMSPFEHVANVSVFISNKNGNFSRYWVQHRKEISDL